MPDVDEDEQILDLTVGALLDRAVARHPEREAVVYSAYDDIGIAERWSYAELRKRARLVARSLMASGVKLGDRIAIWAPNLPQWLELQFGAAYTGAVVVPLNPLYRPPEAEFVLQKSGSVMCFVVDEHRGLSLSDGLASVAPALDDLRRIVVIPAGAEGDRSDWDHWLRLGEATDEQALDERSAQVKPQHSAQIQFTSGTTGRPKGVELSHRGIVNNGLQFARRAGLVEQGRHVNPMPYFHCGGSVMATLGPIGIGGTQLPIVSFDPDRVIRTVDKELATSVSLVPTMMIAIEERLSAVGGSLASLDVVVTGGSPVPPQVASRWNERFGTRFSITYGLTEASPVITQTSPEDELSLQIGTCGVALPGVEVDIVDPVTLDRLPIGEEGELRTRGWLVMKGYWDDEQATRAVLSEEGFLRSGDLARMDKNGYVSITGRAKDMIIRGGENIYPAEVEHALMELPEILNVAVVGVPSEKYGEEPAAFVRLQPGSSMTLDELRERMRDRIAPFKVPRHLRIVDEFPLTSSGKIQKFRLRQQFESATP